jgi:hypothetical protein
MRVGKIDNNFPVQCLVKWPYKYISQKHEETGNQSTDNKHIAQQNVNRKELLFYP